MNAKEYNKYLTALQEELGIHIVSVRNNTSVEDCHKSLAEIGKYLNDKNYKYCDNIMKGYKEYLDEVLKINFETGVKNKILKNVVTIEIVDLKKKIQKYKIMNKVALVSITINLIWSLSYVCGWL